MGAAGVGFTVPKEAMENWRLWINDVPEGIPFDKRMIFLAVGDRDRIGNISLDEFAKLDFVVIKQLLTNREPGQRMVRPSITEACMTTKQTTPPPLIELDSSATSSPDSEGKEDPATPRRGEKRKLGTIMTRGRLQKMKNSPRSKPKQQGSSRNLFSNQEKMDNLTPLQREGIKRLLESCVRGGPSPINIKAGVKRAAEEEAEVSKEGNSSGEDDELKEAETMSCPDDFSPNCSGMFEFSMTSASSCAGGNNSQMSSEPEVLEEKVVRFEMLFGPLPANDSIEVFLARKVNDDSIVDVSTAESDVDAKAGEVSDQVDSSSKW